MNVTRGRGICALLCSLAVLTACGGFVDVERIAGGGSAGAIASAGSSGAGAGASAGAGAGGDPYAGPFKILILTLSIGDYRHDSITDCLRMLADLGQTPDDQMPAGTKPGSQFTTLAATDDLADFTVSGLKDYGMLFWCTPIGPVFSDNPFRPQNGPVAMSALRGYIEGGGAWGGVHSATDFEKTGGFPWYTDSLVGGYLDTFLPDGTAGTVQVEADYADHPVMKGVPATWSVRDEWFKMNRDIGAQPGFQILARLATASDNRPAVWIKDFGGNASGRMFYTIRGHAPAVYHEEAFRLLVLNGILWATHRLEK